MNPMEKIDPYYLDKAKEGEEMIATILWLAKWFVVIGIGYILGRLG
jgi:hypothetical protein